MLSEAVTRARRDIETYGWHVCHVVSEPPFSYTVGLSETFGHRELIVFGLPHEFAHSVLSAVTGLVKDGARFDDGGESSDVLNSALARFALVPARFHDEFAGLAVRVLGKFELLQVVWPRADGKFPGDEGVELPLGQPLLSIGWLGDLEVRNQEV